MLQSWYQKTAQPLVNTLLSFSGHNKLPLATVLLAKNTLITALGGYNSKRHGDVIISKRNHIQNGTVNFFLCYQHLRSMTRRNFWQS